MGSSSSEKEPNEAKLAEVASQSEEAPVEVPNSEGARQEEEDGELEEVKLPLGTYRLHEIVEYKAVIEAGKLWIKAGDETARNDYRFGRFAEWERQRQDAVAAGLPEEDLAGMPGTACWKLGNYCNCNAETADDPNEVAKADPFLLMGTRILGLSRSHEFMHTIPYR